MSEERGSPRQAVRFGCGCALVLLLVVGGLAWYGLLRSPRGGRELTADEGATAKLENLERSLRRRRAFETQFSEAELTLLARQYLEQEGIEGDVTVILPEDDLQLSFRTTLEELERFLNLDQLPSWGGREVWGTFTVHLRVVDNEPYAELESVALYGVPVPLSLLGSSAEENWIERLDSESAAVVRRIRSLEIRDRTLFVTTG